ncbi:uncharacterized protein LOC132637249 [Lycium barbarum]|uniref:uncharacterized protein LOC132637249 n=1 Tax=Lycium barbarum TaxID=112863 RepID=UPI00293EE926|nr:uncharacterized protein LOC132637249 [Lycium barbarum]
MVGESGTPLATKVTESEIAMTSNHPYHLHPSDSPRMNLINVVFDGKGFPRWRRSVLIALSAKKKLGFINGTFKEPDVELREYLEWYCCKNMVTAWLLNSLSKDIKDSVIYSRTTKELWDSLESRFGKSNGAKLFHLEKELNVLVQGNSDILGKAKITKSMMDQRLIKFLMGLNDVYSHARANILMINPLPNMDYAYSLLLRDESQRDIFANANMFSDSSSFMRVTTKRNKFNPNVSCTYCYKVGHTMDDYHRIHGYPDDFKFNKGKNYQKHIKGNAAVACEKMQEYSDMQPTQENNNTFQHFTK